MTDVGVTSVDGEWHIVLRVFNSQGQPIWTYLDGHYRWRWQASREADRLARRHGYQRPG